MKQQVGLAAAHLLTAEVGLFLAQSVQKRLVILAKCCLGRHEVCPAYIESDPLLPEGRGG